MEILSAVRPTAKTLSSLLPVCTKCAKNHYWGSSQKRSLSTVVISPRGPWHSFHVQDHKHQRQSTHITISEFSITSHSGQSQSIKACPDKAVMQDGQFSSCEPTFSSTDFFERLCSTKIFYLIGGRRNLFQNNANFKTSMLLHCLRHFDPLPKNMQQYLLVWNTKVTLPLPAKINFHSLDNNIGSIRHYRGQRRQRIARENVSRQSSDTDDGEDCYHDEHSESDGEESHTERLPEVDARKTGVMKTIEEPPSSAVANVEDERKELSQPRRSVDELTLPELSRVALNIVPYVKRSETLQNLVRLGVNLDKVQKVDGMAELLIKSKFDRDIVPYVKFLRLVGIETDNIGHVISVNPRLLTEPLEELEMRVGYLLHRNFTLQEVATMYTKAPVALLMDPVMLEEKLRFFQEVFGLTEEEVRQVVRLFPKLLPRKKELIADVRFHVKEFLGFSHEQMKQLILKEPKIFVSGKHKLVTNFDYLHNTMLIPHKQVLVWPKILLMRLFIFKNRHLFLLSRGRAQYDPCQENFVSLQALGSGTDEEFCHTVAKCGVDEFYDFCKTL